ncbi:porin [Octadecabacter sp.]|nr:porin [Octadecabacter sp.]
MRNISILALAAAFAPGLAMAQAESGTVSLGYGQIDPQGGSNQDDFSIAGTVDYAIGTGIGFSATGRYDDVEGGFDNGQIFGDLTYDFNGFQAGVFGQITNSDGLGFEDVNTYGVLLGYNLGPIDGQVYYGQSDGNGADEDYGVTGGYSTDQYAVYASYQYSDFDSGDFEAYGATGSYTFAESVSLFATYAEFNVGEGFNDFDAYGVGASYSIDGLVAGNPLVISAEYSTADVDGGNDFDRYGLFLTVPFGGATGVIPEQSLAGAIANPGFSAAGSALNANF